MKLPTSSKDLYDNHKNTKAPTQFDKIFSALFYGFASLSVILINKIVITMYKFTFFDILATSQFLSTTLILFVLIISKKIEVTKLNKEVFCEVFPITLMFLCNVVSGLGGTGQMNIPMFTALRRTSILLTLLGEYFILNKLASNYEIFSIIMMILGAFIAAYYDLTFDFYGYFYVTINNIFTALSGIYLKKASNNGKCNKNGVLFYNSLFSLIMMSLYYICEHFYIHHFSNFDTINNINNNNIISTIDKVISFPGWNSLEFISIFIFGIIYYFVSIYIFFINNIYLYIYYYY